MKIILRLCVSTLTVTLVTLLLEYGRAYFAVNSTLGEPVDQTISLCFLLLMLASVWLYLRCWLGLFTDTIKELIALLRHKKTPQQPVEEQAVEDVAAVQPTAAPEKPRDRDPFDFEASVSSEELDARQQTASALFAGSATSPSEKEFFTLSLSTIPTDAAHEAGQAASKEKQPSKFSEQKKSILYKKTQSSHKASAPSAVTGKAAKSSAKQPNAEKAQAERLQIAVDAMNKVAELTAADVAEEQYVNFAIADVFLEDGGEEDLFANRDGDVWVRSS